MKFSTTWKLYIDTIRHSSKPATVEAYERGAKRFLNKFKSRDVQTIKPHEVQAWFNGLGVRYPSANAQSFDVLKGFFTFAVQQRLIEHNPCLNVRIFRPRTKETVPFEDDEIDRIFQEARKVRNGEAIIVCFMTGLRQSELFGLRWTHVGIKERQLFVSEAVVQVGGSNYTGTPKSRSSIRIVPLNNTAIAAFYRRWDQAYAEGLIRIDDLVFPNCDGSPTKRKNYSETIWKNVLKKAGVEYRGLHTARHTLATKLFANGTGIDAVSKIIGHGSNTVTANRYMRQFKNENVAAMQKMER